MNNDPNDCVGSRCFAFIVKDAEYLIQLLHLKKEVMKISNEFRFSFDGIFVGGSSSI